MMIKDEALNLLNWHFVIKQEILFLFIYFSASHRIHLFLFHLFFSILCLFVFLVGQI
jgi:hypothetical protein